MQASNGNLYGVTTMGGANNGGALYVVTPGGAFAVLHDFQDAAGGPKAPSAIMIGSDGNLYGTTRNSGND